MPAAAFVIGGLVAVIQNKMKKNTKTVVKDTCVICYVQSRSIVLEPCNHLILCEKCARNVQTCPYCRIPIERMVSLCDYLSS